MKSVPPTRRSSRVGHMIADGGLLIAESDRGGHMCSDSAFNNLQSEILSDPVDYDLVLRSRCGSVNSHGSFMIPAAPDNQGRVRIKPCIFPLLNNIQDG